MVCEMHDGRAYDEGSHGAEGEGILPMGLGDDEGCEQGDIDGQVLPSVPLFGVFGVVVGLGLLGVDRRLQLTSTGAPLSTFTASDAVSASRMLLVMTVPPALSPTNSTPGATRVEKAIVSSPLWSQAWIA